MNTSIKAGLAVVLALVSGAVLMTAWRQGFGLCNNDIITEMPSPSGTRKAVVFQRDCGATTGFSTQVSVLPAREELPPDGGNVFVADDDHGQAPSGPGGGPAVEVVWLREERLLIRHHPLARVFRSEPSVGNVVVEYEQR